MAKLKIKALAQGPGMIDVVNKQGQPGILNTNSPTERALIPNIQMSRSTLEAISGKKRKAGK